MAGDNEKDSSNGQFRMEMVEFRGFVTEALKSVEERSSIRLEGFVKMTNEKLETIKERTQENHECACQTRDAVTEIQKQIAVSAAVRKVKDSLWGAVGGAGAMLIIQIGKDFLKAKVLGGK